MGRLNWPNSHHHVHITYPLNIQIHITDLARDTYSSVHVLVSARLVPSDHLFGARLLSAEVVHVFGASGLRRLHTETRSSAAAAAALQHTSHNRLRASETNTPAVPMKESSAPMERGCDVYPRAPYQISRRRLAAVLLHSGDH